jgi:hypothetical protein
MTTTVPKPVVADQKTGEIMTRNVDNSHERSNGLAAELKEEEDILCQELADFQQLLVSMVGSKGNQV